MEKHARLSPSAAHRWLNCTASVELCEGIEDKGSIYAEEGTLAHAICESKLKAYLNHVDARTIYEEENHVRWTDEPLYNPEMEDCTESYRDTVINLYEEALEQTPDAKMLIEQKVIITDALFGTADALIVADGLLNVIDYKHGKGVEVSAEHNPQMMIYALAAYHWYAAEYDIQEVTMTIVQPRIGNHSSWTIKVDDLLRWEEGTLMPTMHSILNNVGTTQKVGDWCKFCKVKARCREIANIAKSTCDKTNPQLMSLEEIAEMLPLVPTIKAWCEEINGYALQQALIGNKISGYKVVEGRTKRMVQDAEALARELRHDGYDDSLIWRPREVETLTNLEKLVGKKAFAERYADYITKPKGSPTLVKESDKRPEWCEDDLQNDYKDIIHIS